MTGEPRLQPFNLDKTWVSWVNGERKEGGGFPERGGRKLRGERFSRGGRGVLPYVFVVE